MARGISVKVFSPKRNRREKGPVSDTGLLKKPVNVDLAVVESARIDGDGLLVVAVRLRKSWLCRCHVCGKKAPVYDVPPQARRWRSLDFGAAKVFLEYKLPRVECPGCSVYSAAVPRAEHASRFTQDIRSHTASQLGGPWWLHVACKVRQSKLIRLAR